MRGRMGKLFAGLVTCGLIATVAGAVHAQRAPDPSQPVVLFDFETADQVSAATVLYTDVDITVEHNTDTEFTAGGSSGSLKVDLTGMEGWHEFLDLALPEALDLSKHPVIAFDLIVPPTSHPGEANDQWFNGGIVAKPAWGSGGDHDYKDGPQHLLQVIRDDARTNVTSFGFYSNSGGPYQGPIYIDNIVALPGVGRGFSTLGDQVLIAGWNDPAEVETMIEEWPFEINRDEAFITEGNGSLSLDLTGQSGWIDPRNEVIDIGPIDLSEMDDLRVDVYLPEEHAADWQKFGLSILMTNGEYWGYQHTLDPGWNTMIWNLRELPEDQRENLKEVIGYRFRCQSGLEFNGPVYVDALRGSKHIAGVPSTPPPPPPGVKGDVDGNGQLAILDVVAALRIVAGLATATPENLTGGDLNANGRIEITEVVQILRAVAGLAPL